MKQSLRNKNGMLASAKVKNSFQLMRSWCCFFCTKNTSLCLVNLSIRSKSFSNFFCWWSLLRVNKTILFLSNCFWGMWAKANQRKAEQVQPANKVHENIQPHPKPICEMNFQFWSQWTVTQRLAYGLVVSFCISGFAWQCYDQLHKFVKVSFIFSKA